MKIYGNYFFLALKRGILKLFSFILNLGFCLKSPKISISRFLKQKFSTRFFNKELNYHKISVSTSFSLSKILQEHLSLPHQKNSFQTKHKLNNLSALMNLIKNNLPVLLYSVDTLSEIFLLRFNFQFKMVFSIQLQNNNNEND